MQTTGQGAFKTRTLRLERSSHPPFSSAFWKMGRVMWDIEEENEKGLCPTVQIKEVIACIASQTGKGNNGKKHINQKTAEDESQRKSIVFVISILQVHIPHKFLAGFCIRCKMKKIHCPCHRSIGWKRGLSLLVQFVNCWAWFFYVAENTNI